LVRSRLRKGLGLIAGASCDQREDEQTCNHSDPTLLHTASSMIHSHLLISIRLIKGPFQATLGAGPNRVRFTWIQHRHTLDVGRNR
jgi:hypothetical protein